MGAGISGVSEMNGMQDSQGHERMGCRNLRASERMRYRNLGDLDSQ